MKVLTREDFVEKTKFEKDLAKITKNQIKNFVRSRDPRDIKPVRK